MLNIERPIARRQSLITCFLTHPVYCSISYSKLSIKFLKLTLTEGNLKYPSKNTTILKTPCYHGNGNFWQHVYFSVIPTIGAMLLVSFVVISYETSKQRATIHNYVVYHN